MESITMTTMKPVSARSMRRYKEIANTYEAIAKVAVIAAGILLAAVITLAVQLSHANADNDSLMNQVDSLSTQNEKLNKQLQNVNSDIASLTDQVDTMTFQNTVMKESLVGMRKTVNTLDASNAKLKKENKSLNSDLKKFTKRAELYNKYEYAVYNKSGKRTDLTYEQIATGEELMKKEGIDPDLLFGIIMTESGGDEKATSSTSTARGYGQFLAGSGKYVYEDILHLGTYNHSMAYNGTTNIKMAAGYLGYLKNTRGFSAYAAVKAYRGLEPTGYIRTINSYIGTKGDSFAKIAANW